MKLFLLCQLALASDSDITTGVVAFQEGDWAGAVTKLEEGLQDPSSLKPKNVPKGWFFLGRAQLHQQLDAGTVATSWVRAIEADTKGTWTDDLISAGAPVILMHAAMAELLAAQALPTGERAAGAQRAVVFATHSLALQPDQHAAHDLRGQARELAGDRDGARQDWARALDLLETRPPTPPDLLAGHIALRLAMTRMHEDPEAALADVRRGQTLLAAEWARTPDKTPETTQAVEAGQKTLRALELDLLMRLPDRLPEALERFDTAVAAEPDNQGLLIAHASLLERVDVDRAREAYARAAAMGGELAFTAWFNLGATWVNEAADHASQANQATDDATYAEHSEGAYTAMEQARPAFEAALALEPQDPATLDALLQVAMTLDDVEAYARYKALRDAL